jgi:hypothetical protein
MQYVQSIEDFTIRTMWWQEAGKFYTASGYGAKIPTEYMVKVNGENRWRRIYCCIYSNSGILYVIVNKQKMYFSINLDHKIENMRDDFRKARNN